MTTIFILKALPWTPKKKKLLIKNVAFRKYTIPTYYNKGFTGILSPLNATVVQIFKSKLWGQQ